MAELWNIPGKDRPSFWTRQTRGLALLLVFALGLAATTLLTGLGSLGSHTAPFRLANLVLATVVNIGLYLLAFRVLTPRQIPTRLLVIGSIVGGVAWQLLLAAGGYLVGHNLKHASEVYGFFAVVLGLLSWLYLGAQLTLYAAEVNVVRGPAPVATEHAPAPAHPTRPARPSRPGQAGRTPPRTIDRGDLHTRTRTETA